MDRHQDISIFDLALISLGLILGNTHAYQRAGRPPAAAPPAAPASAAMIGPAAMNTPSPGIASAPIPTIQPSAPPRTAPLAPPAAAPSGAFVCCSCAKSLLPCLSGNRTDTSLLVKPAAFSWSAMLMAWDSLFAIPNTAFFAMISPYY